MNWTDCRLWKVLLARENNVVRRTIENCLPQVETILRSASTSPLDFTLHDDQHSFRVAERMFDLAERKIPLLSDYELSMLFLSAYLHDIGMAPSRDVVQSHYQYLLTGKSDQLNPLEHQTLQLWLDENWSSVEIPLAQNESTSGLSLAEEICAYYCRERHNDWSDDWIEENLKSIAPGLYPGWIEDLIILCRSHHDGYSELLASKFDARLVGTAASSLNLRYLAALLRTADVLEFDPERTPSVILQHRKIRPKSRVFWHRDHGIAFKLTEETSEVVFSARTPDATIHKAVLSIAEMVNSELACCHRLHQQGAFLRGIIPAKDRSNYNWELPSQLIPDIREKDDSFTYIDGTFRPDVTKLLNLLSGTQLYRNALAAVRELIQNAADAIAEQIGYERLHQDDPENAEHERTFAALHKIKVTFEKNGDRYWLRCTDDGVGLNKRFIESRLLKSGSNDRPEFTALQREARSKGFEVFRTGQFGIGLLSYFMIADRVEFETRRSDMAKDGGGDAWTFTTEGVSSFGELTKSLRDKHGTEVRLRLRETLISDDHDVWFDKLLRYLKSTIRHLPCKFELRNNLRSPTVEWSAGPSWLALSKDFPQADFSHRQSASTNRSDQLFTLEERDAQQKEEARWREILELAAEKVRWFGPIEYTSSKFAARYWLPYFDLPDGASIALFDITNSAMKRTPDDADCLLPTHTTVVSWKGFRAEMGRIEGSAPGLIELDVRAGAEIAINRSALSFEDAPGLRKELDKIERQGLAEFLAANSNSRYHPLNQQLAGFTDKHPIALPSNYYWKTGIPPKAEWTHLNYPFAEISLPGYKHDRNTWESVQHAGTRIPVAQRLSISPSQYAHVSSGFGGGRLVLLVQRFGLIPSSLWFEPPAKKALFWSSQFPKNWDRLLSVKTETRRFWNAEHPIISFINENPDSYPKGKTTQERLLSSLAGKAIAARFVLSELDYGARHFRAMRDEFPNEFAELLVLLGVDKAPLYWWDYESIHSDETRTSMISQERIEHRSACFKGSGALILPDQTLLERPDDDFILEEIQIDEAQA